MWVGGNCLTIHEPGGDLVWGLKEQRARGYRWQEGRGGWGKSTVRTGWEGKFDGEGNLKRLSRSPWVNPVLSFPPSSCLPFFYPL